jgi:hypothetical protein
MSKITHLNYSTTLKESTTARGATPNGNVYFDTTLNEIQLIGADELAQVDFGAGMVTNPLNNTDRITLRALYNFESSRRRVNETLRKYKRGLKGSYRFAGAFNFVNGVKLDGTDRSKIGDSGWIEYSADVDGETNIDRIYHGVTSLVDIQNTTVTYYTFVAPADIANETALQAATWYNFARLGDINEAVQVFGTTAYGDSGAGSADNKLNALVVRARSWQYNPGETTSIATNIIEFNGFSAGYGIGESLNSSNIYTQADVIGGYAGQAGTRISPFTGMSLEKHATTQSRSGFVEGDANFLWTLHNSANGSAEQCAAFLDALTLCDADIESTGTIAYNGKKGRVWYTRNAAGKIVTNGGTTFGSAGLYIEGLIGAEKQKVVMTSDTQSTRTYPFYPNIQINVGAVAVADTYSWIRVMYVEGTGVFDTAGALTVEASDTVGVNYNVNTCPKRSGNIISFDYDFAGNTQGGLSGDRDCVVIVEGDSVGGSVSAAQAIAYFTITETATIPVTCAPVLDNNA